MTRRSVVAGVGSALPKRQVTNEELARTVDGIDFGPYRDWLTAHPEASLADLCLTAGAAGPYQLQAAIAAVHPFGVDVSSGVEERPGVKSPGAIMSFVAAVRAADAVPSSARGE